MMYIVRLVDDQYVNLEGVQRAAYRAARDSTQEDYEQEGITPGTHYPADITLIWNTASGAHNHFSGKNAETIHAALIYLARVAEDGRG